MSAANRACIAAAGTYCGLGFDVPIAPTIVACMAVAMVRALVWTRTRSIAWNVAVCGLAVLAAFATIEGSNMSVFQAFWLGVGYGGIGVGIIEIGKSNLIAALRDGARSVLKTLNGPVDDGSAAKGDLPAHDKQLHTLAEKLDGTIAAEREEP